MFFLEKDVERLLKGTWEADCLEMKLIQNSNEAAQFVGKGYLRQEEGGKIHYRLYPTASSGNVHPASFQPQGIRGVLITPQEYYRLETVSYDGCHWQVDRTLPEVGGAYLESGFHPLVGGSAYEVHFSRPYGISVPESYLTMVFFADVVIPCNARTETTTKIGEDPGGTSVSLDVARFPTSFGQFKISKKQGMVVVAVEADSPYPQNFESRIVEALGLVLAKPLFWNVIHRIEGSIETVHFRGQRRDVKAGLPRPVVGLFEEADMTGDVWWLFSKYLSLVCTHPNARFHPCSRHLFAVLEASAGGWSARGLALGIAAEGIARAMFPEAGVAPEGMKEAVVQLQKLCLTWSGMPSGELGASLRKRLPGMIGQLLNSSTKDKFFALVREKAIYERHIKSWSDLRNTLAHGVTPDSSDTQKLLDLCNEVTVLVYHLIFKATGYEGGYEDYSSRNWPPKRYRGRPVTDEEIAVAAYFLWLKSGRKDGHDLEHWFAGKAQLEEGLA